MIEWVKTHSKEPQRVLDVKFYHEKLDIYLVFDIWNHGNHGTLFLFNTHECQETQIKNPFDPILSFGLVKDLKMKIFIIKKGNFYKEFSKISYNKSKLVVKNMRW